MFVTVFRRHDPEYRDLASIRSQHNRRIAGMRVAAKVLRQSQRDDVELVIAASTNVIDIRPFLPVNVDRRPVERPPLEYYMNRLSQTATPSHVRVVPIVEPNPHANETR